MKILDSGDEAYFLEKRFCHLPILNNQIYLNNFKPYKYHNFVRQKSIGCVVGLVVVSILTGKSTEEIIAFFRQYLSAKQLSDDAADWRDDLKNGIQTGPNSMLLLTLKNTDKIFVDLDTDLPQLEKIFWEDIAPKICRQILNKTTEARKILASMDSLENTDLFEKLLEPIEHGAKRVLCSHKIH